MTMIDIGWAESKYRQRSCLFLSQKAVIDILETAIVHPDGIVLLKGMSFFVCNVCN